MVTYRSVSSPTSTIGEKLMERQKGRLEEAAFEQRIDSSVATRR